MKKFIFILMFVCSFFFFVSIDVEGASSNAFYTISCNPGEDANTEMRINWHTDLELTNSYVLYTEKTDTNWEKSVKVQGECKMNTAFTGANCSGEAFMQNGAVLSGLKSSTEYMYKISNGTEESEVRYFKTGGGSSFSFVWTSDFHAYYDNASRLNNATAVINDAIEVNGGVDFILSTGDTVAHGGTYKWWQQVAGASWMKNYMYADVLGNHDWMTKAGTTVAHNASNVYFGACHNNPKNGYSGQENICYYFYYGDALFVCLNTEEYSQAQKDWVCDVLDKNSAQYIFLVQHYQTFNGSGSKNSAGYTRWADVCDEYGVDVFFSGNSHIYVRSNRIYNDALCADESKGTVYMVAPSSDGDRGESWSSFSSNQTLLAKGWAGGTYQVACSVVNVTPDGVVTKLINKGGEVLDSALIRAKRAPSDRTVKDVAEEDKKTLEDSIGLIMNSKNLSCPRIKFDGIAYDIIKSMKIYNKDTNKVYLDSMIEYNTKFIELSGFEKGILNIVVQLNYYDNTVKNLEIEFKNAYNWGSISKEKITEYDDKVTLTWKEGINLSRVSALDIYLNGDIFKTLEFGVQTIDLPKAEPGKVNIVKIVIIDIDGDICFEKEFEYKGAEPKFTVTFVDKDGKELSKVTVDKDAAATAPEAPAVKGYEFKGWDKDFSKVTEDLTVAPIYEVKKYNVKFLDKDGKEITTVEVEYGKDATAPEAPAVEGYEFKGWDKEFVAVKEDLEVKALYEEIIITFTVTFVDKDGKELSKVTVEKDAAATAPEAPAVEGYEFKGWDKDFSKVTEDLTVKALYEAKAGEPDPDPKPNPDPEPEPSGCNSGSLIFTTIMLLGLCFFRRKRS